MKTLYLVRHARAIPSDAGVNDFKRSLSKRGRNDAQAMSKRLCKKGIYLDLLISSPADRALETAHIFAERFDYPIQKVLLRDEIYDEEEETLREIIKELDDSFSRVMLFGHEPALSQAANFLLQNSDIALCTTGVVGISLDIPSWKDIAEGTGTLLLFDFPVHATPKMYKKARKTIAREITLTIEDTLENIDVEASKHLEKLVEKTGKKLAKELIKVLQASKVEEIAGVRTQKRVDNLMKEEMIAHADKDARIY